MTHTSIRTTIGLHSTGRWQTVGHRPDYPDYPECPECPDRPNCPDRPDRLGRCDHLELLHVVGHGVQPPPVLVPVLHGGAQDVPDVPWKISRWNMQLYYNRKRKCSPATTPTTAAAAAAPSRSGDPPLDSEMRWTGELWSKNNLLKWQN